MRFITSDLLQPFGKGFFDDALFAPVSRGQGGRRDSLATDIREDDGKYEFIIDVPGYKKEEIELSYEDGYLTVKAERTSVNPDKKSDSKDVESYVIRERRVMSASRSFYVGDVDESTISADLNDGVLCIKIPKEQPEKAESKKRIAIGG